MAETQTTVALNIGSQSIGMAVFETSKSGDLILKAYETETVTADPAMESSRESQTRAAIEDLVNRLKVSKSKVRYAISGQAVFTRFVKLPPIQDDNLEQLVTFEAQQHVPFPISEVVWDYELIEGGTDKEVVIVAIKADALDEINDSVNSAGISTAEVDIAPMALYNSYRSAYGAPQESTLIIDIGARTTNLLYVEGNRFFTRSVAIGGTSISAGIAKEYNVSFQDAENQKVTNGLVALGGGHTETMDEPLAALAMVIRNALTRLPAEISRTTNYYRSQHGGNAPTRVLLAGGGANLPYTLEFLNEKLGIPVDYFNPLANVSIGKDVDTDRLRREAHTMGELVGLGLRGIGKSIINIDLVPAAVEVTRAADRRKPFLIAAAALFVLGFAAWALLQFKSAVDAELRAKTMADSQESLSPVESQVRGLLGGEEQLSKIAKSYSGIVSDHAFWFDLTGELRTAFASDAVWMTELSPLYGYDPITAVGSSPEASQVVASDFDKNSDSSSITNPPAQSSADTSKKGSRSKSKEPEMPVFAANAILIKGFWRENSRSQNIVSDLVKRLRENSAAFTFSVPGEKGKMIELSDDQILKVSLTGEEGDLGYPFQLTLPLARPVVVK